jgi:hypothetical protein
MHSACRLIALGGLVLKLGYGQPDSVTASQLEALERFANRPTAHVTWSAEVARIDTDQAHAVITAIVVEDATETPRQMRGVRIDLTSANAKDQMYTSEDLIERLISALNEISHWIPRSLLVGPRHSSSNRCFGSGVFRFQSVHAFSASECVYGNWSGLVVGDGFRFTSLDPSRFAEAIARARDELKQR